jgi:hypothetical protein
MGDKCLKCVREQLDADIEDTWDCRIHHVHSDRFREDENRSFGRRQADGRIIRSRIVAGRPGLQLSLLMTVIALCTFQRR